jgi:TonB family protein
VVLGTLALEINTMRRIIVATLLLSPMLLHAQASSPAQPQTSTLQSNLVHPATFGSEPESNTVSTATTTRISTGVNAPKLVYVVDVASDAGFTEAARFERTAVVSMVVDPRGKPSDLKIVQSVNPIMDKNVLAAVSQYRFTPGTLDNQPTSIPVNLSVVLRGSIE